MVRHPFRLINVFTRETFGGNPLAVFPESGGLPAATMQAIAQQMNLSETTFVGPSSHPGCDLRVRIFTPRTELPIAGHPTVGTAFALDRGPSITFEEGVGPVLVERSTDRQGVIWRMTQPAPRLLEPVHDRSAVAEALGLEAQDLDSRPVCIGSVGVPFLIVPLRRLEALARLRVDVAAWSRVRGEALGLYAFVQVGDSLVRARMVGAEGIPEDPATGGAAGPLGAYLARLGGIHERVIIEQGIEMGRPSRICVDVVGRPEHIEAVRVGGACIEIGAGSLELPGS